MRHKVAFVHVGDKKMRVEEIDRDDILGPADWGIHCHLELYESFKYPPYDEHNVFCFGMGKLAGGVLSGTHRLIATFRSPLWGGLYLSTVGGAAYVFRYIGVDYVTIEGRSSSPTIIILKGTKDGPKAQFDTISREELDKIYRSYKGWEGVYAFYRYLLERYKDVYKKDSGYMEFRMLVVGPAALNTNMGGVFSTTIRNGEIDVGSEGWMARGGGGSVLYQAHSVVAIIYGGDNEWRTFEGSLDLKNPSALNEFFEEHLGKPMSKAVFDATEKYRYSPSVGSGGTFGVNYSTLRDRAIMFNWNSIYLEKETRMGLYEKLIRSHYLKQFNEEIIKPRSFKTCGEPCPGVCKKVRDVFKKDYEVYSALGPICGIFDHRAAEKTVHAVDSMGFDAIEFGTLAGWVLECLKRGLLKPEEVGVSELPKLDPETFKLEDSNVNAEIVAALARKVAFGEGKVPQVLGKGMRRAAKELNEMFKDRVKKVGLGFNDLAVYVPLGEEGSIAPCQYWDPAFLMPLPLQGTFFTRYHAPFMEPEDFAKVCYERFIHEFSMGENLGMCRFHRGWAEKIGNALLNAAYGINVDLLEHGKEALKRLVEYDVKAEAFPKFWESERVLDIFWTFMNVEAKAGNEVAQKWLKEHADKRECAEEYWRRFLNKFEELVGLKWSL